MLDKILVPVDLTEVSELGISSAREIAKKFSSRVSLLYVLEPPKDIPFEIFEEEKEAINSLREKLKLEAENRLKDYAASLQAAGIQADYTVLEGDDTEAILDYCQKTEPDLLIMPSHRKTKVELQAVGSVSLRVASRSSKSVLIVKQKPLTEINNILVNYDFLPSSIVALEKAVSIAKAFGSKLTVLHIDNDEHHTQLKSIYQKVLEKKYKLLEEIKNKHKDVKVETILQKGSPKEEVLRMINRNGYDLVVMGRRNTADKSRVFLGSLSLEVLKNSPVSVLISRGNYE